MTIQQMLLAGGAKKPPVYIGATHDALASGATISVSTPSTTKAGDLVLAFGSGTDGGRSWTMAGMTEVADGGHNPNLYCGYGFAAGDGANSYTLVGSSGPKPRLELVVFRHAVYAGSSFVIAGNVSSSVMSLASVPANSTIVGFVAVNQNGGAITVSNSPVTIRLNTTVQPVSHTFYKEKQSGPQSYTAGGVGGSNPMQHVLVALAPG